MSQESVVIDIARARLIRLRRRAEPIGIEVRMAGHAFALHGPDRGLYLHPGGVSREERRLTYDEAAAALMSHLAAPVIPPAPH